MTSHPRVVHLYRYFMPDFTGDGLYYAKLIPLMQKAGSDHHVVVSETRLPSPEAAWSMPGCKATYLANGPDRPTNWRLFWWLLTQAKSYDVVHIHSHIDRSFMSYLLARALGKSVLFSASLDDSPTQVLDGYSPFWRPVARVLMHSIDRFVVIGPHLMRYSLQTQSRDRVVLVPQGAEQEASAEGGAHRDLRDEFGIDPDAPVLITIGSVIPRKNTLFLVQALGLIDRPCHLFVVGPLSDADYKNQIEDQIKILDIDKYVHFLGYYENPEKILSQADIFVFASISEGFGNVYLEAMMASIPVVTLHLENLTDHLFVQNETGLISSGMTDFVTNVQSLLRDPERRREIGQNGRAFATRNFRIEQAAHAYNALYRDPMCKVENIALDEAPLFPDVRGVFCHDVSQPGFMSRVQAVHEPKGAPPVLTCVIDTESEFDWGLGVQSDRGEVQAGAALPSGIGRLLDLGLQPCLVCDHPMLTTDETANHLRALAAAGCDLGVHMQTWTTPPRYEAIDGWHSFSGNLGPHLERQKLQTMVDRFVDVTGYKPQIFKAGRYGVGPNTYDSLKALGFRVDLSFCPSFDFSDEGGVDYSEFLPQPAWVDGPDGILVLPTTGGLIGKLNRIRRFTDLPPIRRSIKQGLRTLLGRSSLSYATRLSPEGVDLPSLVALTKKLHRDGLRTFTLSFHSPSLVPGYTPYVRTSEQLRAFHQTIADYVRFFTGEFGGRLEPVRAIAGRVGGLELTDPGQLRI
jgi:glycosyltransferase involved in cell wall biosynthesis